MAGTRIESDGNQWTIRGPQRTPMIKRETTSGIPILLQPGEIDIIAHPEGQAIRQDPPKEDGQSKS